LGDRLPFLRVDGGFFSRANVFSTANELPPCLIPSTICHRGVSFAVLPCEDSDTFPPRYTVHLFSPLFRNLQSLSFFLFRHSAGTIYRDSLPASPPCSLLSLLYLEYPFFFFSSFVRVFPFHQRLVTPLALPLLRRERWTDSQYHD